MNTGILCAGLRVVDVDVDDATLNFAVLEAMLDRLGDPACSRFRQSSARFLAVYRAEAGDPTKLKVNNETTGYAVEILGHGQQCVVDGIHLSGDRLEWNPTEGLASVARHELTVATDAGVHAFLSDVRAILGVPDETPAPAPTPPATQSEYEPLSDDDLTDLIDNLPNDNIHYDAWACVISAIYKASKGRALGFQLAKSWSAKSTKNDDRQTQKKWREVAAHPTHHGIGFLINQVRKAHPDWLSPSAKDRQEHANRFVPSPSLKKLRDQSTDGSLIPDVDF